MSTTARRMMVCKHCGAVVEYEKTRDHTTSHKEGK